MTAPAGPPTPATATRSGKGHAAKALLAELLSERDVDLVIADPKGRQMADGPVDEQDDVALDDVLMLLVDEFPGLGMVGLGKGSPAWNVVRARQLAGEQPWAACVNTLAERGRDQ